LNEDWDALIAKSGDFARDIVSPAVTLRDMALLGRGHSTMGQDRTLHDRIQDDTQDSSVDPSMSAESNSGTVSVRQTPVPFFYAIPVWGERYVNYLCRYALASMLAPNNLPSLTNNDISTIIIITTPEDEKRIRATDVYGALAEILDFEFVHFSLDGALPTPEQHEAKYNLAAVGHSMAADRAVNKGCAIFLAPDAIYSDGMFSRLHMWAQAGKQVVVGMGPRVNEETIVPELADLGLLEDGAPLALRSRKAVELFMRHMHEDARALRWSSPFFAQGPNMCMWDISGGEGVLLRCFTLHPYLVDYRTITGHRPRPKETSAADPSFVIDCLIPWYKVHQVIDSDELMVLSLTQMEKRDYAPVINSNPMQSIASSSRRPDISILHRAYFMNAIKMHAGDLDDRWSQLERDTLKIAYDALWHSPDLLESATEEIRDLKSKLEQQSATVRVNEILTQIKNLNALLSSKENELEQLATVRVNDILARGDPKHISAKMALRVLLRKIRSRLGFRY
jgi:hypothetical protein